MLDRKHKQEVDKNGSRRTHHFPRGFFNDQFGWFNKAIALVQFPLASLFATWMIHWHLPCDRVEMPQPPGLHQSKRNHPTLGPSSSPAHLTETHPPIVPLLLDLPFVGTPPMGCPFFESTAGLFAEKVGPCSPSSSFGNHHAVRGHMFCSPEAEVRSEHSSVHGVMKTCPNWYHRLDPVLSTMRMGTC